MSNSISSLVKFSATSETTWREATSNITANAGDLILCDTTQGSFTVALPAMPTLGMCVTLKDQYATWSTNGLTVDPGSQKLFGAATTASLSLASITLIYLGTTPGWQSYSVDSQFGAQLRASSSPAAARTGLGLGTLSLQAAASVAITGGTLDGVTIGTTTPGPGTFTNLTASTPLVTDASGKVATTLFVYEVMNGNWINSTTTYTMGATQYPANIYADTTLAPFTLTLPSSPQDGAKIVIVDSKKTWGTNNLTINPNGQSLSGDTTNLVCDASGFILTFIFKTSVGWLLSGTTYQ